MRKYLFGLAVMSAAAVAWAQAPAATKPMPSNLTAEVVSTDVAAKTITVKAPGGMEGSATAVLKVGAKAASALKTLQPGDRVSLTCEAKSKTSASDTAMRSERFAEDCASVTSIAKGY